MVSSNQTFCCRLTLLTCLVHLGFTVPYGGESVVCKPRTMPSVQGLPRLPGLPGREEREGREGREWQQWTIGTMGGGRVK